MAERILDIGIGSGGAYIHRRARPDETRVGIDVNERKLAVLKRHFPEVVAVTASAEHLPFADDFFARADIILPSDRLTTHGLHNRHPIPYQDTGEEYVPSDPHGWYEELQRVLIPEGTVTIFGDMLVNPEVIQETAEGFFDVVYSRRLTVNKLRALGTLTVSTVMRTGPNMQYLKDIGKPWEDTLVEIKLRSTKQT